MIYTIAKEKVFIPKCDGNKDLPEGKQGKVIINFPSVAEIAKASDSLDQNGLFNLKIYVKGFINYQIDDNGKIRDLTAEDVFNQPNFSGLYTEIKTEIDKLTVVDKKK